MVRLQEADIVIWLGAKSEYYLAKSLGKQTTEKRVLNLQNYLVQGVDGYPDPHLWLSSKQAVKIAQLLAEQLVQIDSERESVYRDNLQAFTVEITQLEKQIKEELGALNLSYLVYHDAYRYFEQEYGLSHQGVVSLQPEVNPGAKHLLMLQQTIQKKKIGCIVAEPESNSAVMKILVEDTAIELIILDPLGNSLTVGRHAYARFLRGVAETFKRCRVE